jgi:hypothetical protein
LIRSVAEVLSAPLRRSMAFTLRFKRAPYMQSLATETKGRVAELKVETGENRGVVAWFFPPARVAQDPA